MITAEAIAGKNSRELVHFTQEIINAAYETKSSAVLLSSVFVSLKEKLQYHTQKIGSAKYLDFFEDVISTNNRRLKAVKALEYYLRMVGSAENQALSIKANSLLVRYEDAAKKGYLPISSYLKSMADFISFLEYPENRLLRKELKLDDFLTAIAKHESHHSKLAKQVNNDLFINSEMPLLLKSRDELEVAISKIFSFGLAMEISSSDPSWKSLLRKVDELKPQRTNVS